MSTSAPLVRDPPVAFLTPELGGNVRRPADLAADTLFSLLTALPHRTDGKYCLVNNDITLLLLVGTRVRLPPLLHPSNGGQLF
jgi:hypothetical protein